MNGLVEIKNRGVSTLRTPVNRWVESQPKIRSTTSVMSSCCGAPAAKASAALNNRCISSAASAFAATGATVQRSAVVEGRPACEFRATF